MSSLFARYKHENKFSAVHLMKPSQEAAVAGSQAIGAKRGPLGVRCSGSENQNDRAAKLPVADEGAKQVKGPALRAGLPHWTAQ